MRSIRLVISVIRMPYFLFCKTTSPLAINLSFARISIGSPSSFESVTVVITSYSIHYTKLYEVGRDSPILQGDRITSYNVCYTKLLRFHIEVDKFGFPAAVCFFEKMCCSRAIQIGEPPSDNVHRMVECQGQNLGVDR